MKNNLRNMTEMLNKARAGKYAVAAININNLEWIGAVLDAAQEMDSPIILSAAQCQAEYMGGWKNVVDMVSNLIIFKNISIPVALHLDHGKYEACVEALKAGFPSVMFDGSSLPFEGNVAKTKEIVALADSMSASVEAEVGGIGGTEDGVTSSGEIANSVECSIMAKDTGIACLAAGIGNIHGIYSADWKGLNFDKLTEISNTTNLPLVLHGGSGIPEDQIKKAILLGVCKINVDTECQLAFANATRKYIEDKKDLDKKSRGFDVNRLLKPGYEAIKAKVKEKILMFGSNNKA